MYEVFLLILTGLFAWIAWQDLRLGVLVIAAALPSYLLRFSIAGIPLTFLEVMILALTLIWIVKEKPVKARLPKHWVLPISLLLLAGIISVFVSPDRLSALGVLKAYFVEPMMLFFVMVHVLKKEDIFKVFSALGIGGLVVAGLGTLQALTTLGIPAPWDIEGRITSIYPYPNAVGLFLGPIVTIGCIAFYVAAKFKMVRSGVFWGAVVLLGSAAIFLAKTEAAFVAIPVTLFLVSLFHNNIRRITIPVAILGIVLLAAIPQIRVPVTQKLTLQDYSGGVRLSQWHDTAEFLKTSTVFGAGLSGYPIVIEPYHSRPEFEIFQYPHNVLLNTWVELGLLGLVAFALLAVAAVRTSIPLLNANAPAPILTVAVIAPIVELHIHGLVDVPYFKNDLAALTWVLLALLVLIRKHYATE